MNLYITPFSLTHVYQPPLSRPHIMTLSIELTALPSLTSNLSDLPRMRDIDPNLLHVSPFSPSGAVSQAKLEAALKHTHSTPSLILPTHSNPPSSPSSDEFLMMKPTLHAPDQAAQGYRIKQPITLDDNRLYHFKEYIGESFHDRNGELMRYACFECITASSIDRKSVV